MTKERKVNAFDKGLNTDEHKINTKDGNYISAKNVTFTTDDDNQLILQNMSGLTKVSSGKVLTLPDGYKPVAVKELRGIVYIVSSSSNTTFGYTDNGAFGATGPSVFVNTVGDHYEAVLGLSNVTGVYDVEGVDGTGSIVINSVPTNLGVEGVNSTGNLSAVVGHPVLSEQYMSNTIYMYSFYNANTASKKVVLKLDGVVIADVPVVPFVDTKETMLNKIATEIPINNSNLSATVLDNGIKVYVTDPLNKVLIQGKALKWEVDSELNPDAWTEGADLTLDKTYVFPNTAIDMNGPTEDTTLGDSLELTIDGTTYTYIAKDAHDLSSMSSVAVELNALTSIDGYTVTSSVNNLIVTRSDNTNANSEVISLTTTVNTSRTKVRDVLTGIETSVDPLRVPWSITLGNSTLEGWVQAVTPPVITVSFDTRTYNINALAGMTVESLASTIATELSSDSLNWIIESAGNTVNFTSLQDSSYNGTTYTVTSTTAWEGTNPTITNVSGAVTPDLSGSRITVYVAGTNIGTIVESTILDTLPKILTAISNLDLPSGYSSTVVGNTVVFSVENPTGDVEIGTYPGFGFTDKDDHFLVDEYKPFMNYANGNLTPEEAKDDANYTSRFRTSAMNLDVSNGVEIELQTSYDGSVNVILSDGTTAPRIINSRFKPSEGDKYTMADRRQLKDTNTYSDDIIASTELIQKAIAYIPKLDLEGFLESGNMKVGNYRFYFRYSDADGNITNIIEESRRVAIFHGNTYQTANSGAEGSSTTKAVSFKLSGLDPIYPNIKVYYSYAHGKAGAVTKIYEIKRTYSIVASVCDVLITGNELSTEVDSLTLNFSYSEISSIGTLAQSQNRLLLGGIESRSQDFSVYEEEAKKINVRASGSSKVSFPTDLEDTVNNGYSDPNNIYNYLGYWPGEIYEVGVVFITDFGETPVFHVKGGDFYDNINGEHTDTLGRIRINKRDSGDQGRDVCGLYFYTTNDLDPTIKGMFFVRKERKKWAKYQGISCPTYSTLARYIPTTTVDLHRSRHWGPVGYGPNTPELPVVWAPLPAYMTEMQVYTNSDIQKNYIKLGPPRGGDFKAAFYSGDAIADAQLARTFFSTSLIFNDLDRSLHGTTKEFPHPPNTEAFPLIPYLSDIRYTGSGYNTSFITANGKYVDSSPSYVPDGFTGVVERSYIIDINTEFINTPYWVNHQDTQVDEGPVRWTDDREIWTNSKYAPYVGIDSSNSNLQPNGNIPNDFLGRTQYWRKDGDDWDTNDNETFGPIEVPIGALVNVCSTVKPDFLNYTPNNSEKYFAITPRISTETINNGSVHAYDGDNYIGLSSYKAWGATGDPEVIDRSTVPKAKQTGYNNCGFVLSWLSANNTNTQVRMNEEINGEDVLFGGPRGYYPIKSIKGIQSDLQQETAISDVSARLNISSPEYFQLDDSAPTYNYSFPNRIVASSASVISGFNNGYRQFKNVNFKDYDPSMGPIIKLITLNDTVYIICEKGIGSLKVSEKTLIGGEKIKVDSVEVLPDRLNILSKEYGIQSLESADSTTRAIYGIDKGKNIIWQIGSQGFKVISRFTIQKKLREFKDQFTGSSYNTKVVADIEDGKVYFTYLNSSGSIIKTLVYSEDLSIWECETDNHPYSIETSTNGKIEFELTEAFKSIIYKVDRVTPCVFRDSLHEFEIEFVVNTKSEVQKVLSNLQLVSTNELPKKVVYTYTDNNKLGDDNEYSVEQIIYERGEDLPGMFSIVSVSTNFIVLDYIGPIVYSDDVMENFLSKIKFIQGGNGTWQNTVNEYTGKSGNYYTFSTVDTQVASGIVDLYAAPISLVNADILMDEGYITCGRNHTTNTSREYIINRKNRDIRDKSIKVKLVYGSSNKVYIQKVISTINI